ncbi:hypothetical protein PGT21_016912 [Puccinia graminis f. sp. tritici]|uniref:Uncharacterized protein n=1 Tax=Puccinia graminis f. sp. tritici TaxID=56615 RepID=A0A5B0M2V8_PUCGR|nr:hypothetical protein PGT21_016912 [Puccinia graminis f. sp. tritici]
MNLDRIERRNKLDFTTFQIISTTCEQPPIHTLEAPDSRTGEALEGRFRWQFLFREFRGLHGIHLAQPPTSSLLSPLRVAHIIYIRSSCPQVIFFDRERFTVCS